MTGEYSYLSHNGDFQDASYDAIIEPGMTLCVESDIGESGVVEGVKLEQVLISEDGVKLLCQFPFEDALLN